MNKKNNEKLNKIKDLYFKYKEAKKDPRKKAGMKLLGYFIFFFIFLLIAGITNNMSSNNSFNTTYNNITTTTKTVDKYIEKQNKLLTNKYNINYIIKYNNNEYKINGLLEENIVEGYLEDLNNITKIIIKNNEIYTVNSSNEEILNIDFDKKYLNLENVLNIIKKNSAFIQEKENIKTYLYEIENDNYITKIYVKTNEENILSIEIIEFDNIYLFNFDN